MHTSNEIRSVSDIYQGQTINLPAQPGVYAFWWISAKDELMSANRHIVLKGPGEKPVDVEYLDWWPEYLSYPCLYVGKSTNIKKRFSLHIKRKSFGRLHPACPNNTKAKPATTSCQLRFGIEHVFPQEAEPLSIIFKSVGFSYSLYPPSAIADRFFEEDRLIGTWRPWFNVDSER